QISAFACGTRPSAASRRARNGVKTSKTGEPIMETENELSEAIKPRRGIDYRKLIVVWLLLVVLFVAINMFWNRSKMAGKLQEELAELDRSDPGWRLEEIESARDQMPDEENSAQVLIEATHHLSQPWPPPGFPSEPFHIVPPNELLDKSDFDRL